MKYILEHDIGDNRLHKGSINGREYESFPVRILFYDDESKEVYEEEVEYKKFFKF